MIVDLRFDLHPIARIAVSGGTEHGADKANSIQKVLSSDDSSSANICSRLRMLRISATSRLCPLSCSRCKVISKWQCDGDDDYGDDDDDDDHLLQG